VTVAGKPRVLITGGTGTIGRALIDRFHAEWDITVFSRDEVKQARLAGVYPDLVYDIGDVRDRLAVAKAMRHVDWVIHAAAMKRIEVCEAHPFQAVLTNVVGSENVVQCALDRGIDRLISICTDKGVEPVNVYGMTKAIEERITIAAGFNAVRYGNVFGSTGSVVPLFHSQRAAGVPLTVTDPTMTRFILRPKEAIDLIHAAFTSPMEGKIFVKKSPAARVGDIASCFGGEIKVIGKTRGEKLHEMLIAEEETTRVRDVGDSFVIYPDTLTAKYGAAYSSDKERLMQPDEIGELIEEWTHSPFVM
jgi:UDP-glucose 4-epimerase